MFKQRFALVEREVYRMWADLPNCNGKVENLLSDSHDWRIPCKSTVHLKKL